MLNSESICAGTVADVVGMDGNGATIRGRFDADEALIGEIAKIEYSLKKRFSYLLPQFRLASRQHWAEHYDVVVQQLRIFQLALFHWGPVC